MAGSHRRRLGPIETGNSYWEIKPLIGARGGVPFRCRGTADPRQTGIPLQGQRRTSVKNIARPVRVYPLRPQAVAGLPPPSVLTAMSRGGRTAGYGSRRGAGRSVLREEVLA